MKQFLLFILLLSLVACTEKQEISPKQLLEKVIEKNGINQLSSATISFSMSGMNYTAERNGNEYRYTMTRTKDSITYKAMAYNGGFEYTENGIEKSYGSQNGQVERQLMAMNDFMALPSIFMNDNSVAFALKTPVRIDGVNYQVVHAHYTASMPTDLINNYYLYIHEDNYSIDFIGYDFQPANGRLFFRESFNTRTINGVTFNDYRTFRTKDNTVVLDSLPRLFLRNQMDLQSAFSPQDIQLKRNLKN